MFTPEQALARNAGPALPSPYGFFEQRRWPLRLGWMTMIAGAPNVGKSAFALDLVRKLKRRTLFVSADTDPFTMATRIAAQTSGLTIAEVEENPLAFAETLRSESWLRMTFEAGPTLEDLDEEVDAACELWGSPPEVIVIDNLINIECDDGDEFRGLRLVVKALHRLTRTTGALTLVLHHVTGEFEDGTNPPPRRSLHGKVSRLPEQVITLGAQPGFLGLAMVKNRGGESDPLASNPVWMRADFSRMQFSEQLVWGG